MMRQMFRLMWNRKKRNSLLMLEIFLSFLVLFTVASMAISSIHGYVRPLGFDYENTWILTPNWRGGSEQTDAERRPVMQQIAREISAYPEVKSASWITGCLPYLGSIWRTGMTLDDLELTLDVILADDNTAAAMGLPLSEGRWFGPGDNASVRKPIVISQQIKEDFFPDRPAVGAVFTDEDGDGNITEYEVVGVTGYYRYQGEFSGQVEAGSFFQRNLLSDTTGQLPNNLVIGVREDADMAFEERLSKRLASMAPGWNFKIVTLAAQRRGHIRDHLLGLATYAIIAAFLVFNVALGLFGILWYSISRRRSEIGLRRAVGAWRGRISGQILGEAAVLATFGIIAGIFVAVQVPILGLEQSIGGPIYLLAMAVAAVLIYLIVSVCAMYPGHLAARIQPAEALHDE